MGVSFSGRCNGTLRAPCETRRLTPAIAVATQGRDLITAETGDVVVALLIEARRIRQFVMKPAVDLPITFQKVENNTSPRGSVPHFSFRRPSPHHRPRCQKPAWVNNSGRSVCDTSLQASGMQPRDHGALNSHRSRVVPRPSVNE
jgi:hypothetical protein